MRVFRLSGKGVMGKASSVPGTDEETGGLGEMAKVSFQIKVAATRHWESRIVGKRVRLWRNVVVS